GRARRARRQGERSDRAALRPRSRRRSADAAGSRRRARPLARAHPPDRVAREGEAAPVEARARAPIVLELSYNRLSRVLHVLSTLRRYRLETCRWRFRAPRRPLRLLA